MIAGQVNRAKVNNNGRWSLDSSRGETSPSSRTSPHPHFPSLHFENLTFVVIVLGTISKLQWLRTHRVSTHDTILPPKSNDPNRHVINMGWKGWRMGEDRNKKERGIPFWVWDALLLYTTTRTPYSNLGYGFPYLGNLEIPQNQNRAHNYLLFIIETWPTNVNYSTLNFGKLGR